MNQEKKFKWIDITLQLSKKGDALSLLYFGGGGKTGLDKMIFSFGFISRSILSDECLSTAPFAKISDIDLAEWWGIFQPQTSLNRVKVSNIWSSKWLVSKSHWAPSGNSPVKKILNPWVLNIRHRFMSIGHLKYNE